MSEPVTVALAGYGYWGPNLARNIVAQLRDGGRVRRGWLGVNIQQVTDEIAESLGLRGGARGALVARAQELGVEAAAAQLDIRDPASVTRLVETAVSDFGRLDVWVNNAGVYPNRPVLEIDNDTWDTVLDINLRGTFVGTREAAKVMREAGAA